MLKQLTLAVLAWTVLTAAPAQAALFRIEATSKAVAFSDFVIEFDDLDGDALYSRNELTFFSGVFRFPATINQFLDTLVRFEKLPGISDDSNLSGIRFDFENTVSTAPVTAWDFTISAVEPITAVPVPAAAPLYLLGLLSLGFRGFGFLRRSVGHLNDSIPARPLVPGPPRRAA